MIIHFERSGGFAGMRLATRIDSESLAPEDVRALKEDLDRASFFNLPKNIETPARGADRFQYQITVEAEGRQHTVEFGESATPEELQPLIDRLMTLARTRRGQ